MRNLRATIIVSLLVLSAGLFGASIALFFNPSTATETKRAPILDMNPEIVPACNSLITDYNTTNNLISETKAHQKYWIYSDNLLASIVLYPICKRMDLATNINTTLTNYPHSKFPNQYQTLVYNASNFNATKDFNLSDSIWITLNNQTGTLSPNDYADIAFLESYYARWTTNTTEAQQLFETGASMYNGKGLVDQAFTGQYQTFKLALYIIAAAKLNQTIPFNVTVTLGRMQNPVGGGFYTQYYGNYSTSNTTTTNTETTSLAIIALANLTSISNYSHSDLVRQVSPLAYPLTYAAIGTGITAVILLVVIAVPQRKSLDSNQRP